MKIKNFTVSPWVLGLLIMVAVLAILWAIGVFDTADVKAAETDRNDAEKVVDTLTTRRDSTIATAAESSTKSVEIANELIKNLPDEKYNVIRDTSVDYMFRKITE